MAAVSYLSQLANEIADSEAFHSWRGAAAPSVKTDDTAERGQIARSAAVLATELIHVATLSAIVSSVLNAFERDAFHRLPLSYAKTFLPRHTALFDAVSAQLGMSDTAQELVRSLQNYSARFQLAERLAFALPTDVASSLELDAAPIGSAADAWRRLCAATLTVERLAAEAASGHDWQPAGIERERARHMLGAAVGGGWPCLDDDGRVSVPGWAERRRSARIPVNLESSVIHGDRIVSARVIDISAEGAQIEADISARPGDRVVVTLPDARQSPATVRWARDGRFGLLLDAPQYRRAAG